MVGIITRVKLMSDEIKKIIKQTQEAERDMKYRRPHEVKNRIQDLSNATFKKEDNKTSSQGMTKAAIHQFYLDIYKWQEVVDRLRDLGYDGVTFNPEEIEYYEILDFMEQMDEFYTTGSKNFARKRTDEYITHMENADNLNMQGRITYAYSYDMDELEYLKGRTHELRV